MFVSDPRHQPCANEVLPVAVLAVVVVLPLPRRLTSTLTHAPLIAAVGIQRTATDGDRVILSRLDFTLAAGERIGLVGPTGAGKSSLLRALALLDSRVEGEIWFRGQLVSRQIVPQFRRRVSYFSQHPSLAGDTMRDALRLPFQWRVSEADYDETRVQTLFAALQLELSLLDQPASVLSGGQRQLISLVRTLQLDPVALLLDEPTAALDPDSAQRFELVVAAWQGQQPDHAYVWTSHDSTQVLRMTDRVATIKAGHLVDSAGSGS